MERKIVNVYVMSREQCSNISIDRAIEILSKEIESYRILDKRCSAVVPNLAMVRVEVPMNKDIDGGALEHKLMESGFTWVKVELVVIR